MASVPILYSFRRCPYAIRARMTLHYAGVELEHREVALAHKPKSMLEASAKGTVPVLVLPTGEVLDESLDVMDWALAQHDPDEWRASAKSPQTIRFIEANDGPFKHWLDRYKYSDRYPERSAEDYCNDAHPYLRALDAALQDKAFLAGDSLGYVDVAVFPFVRQFAGVDQASFTALDLPSLAIWLEHLLDSRVFLDVMEKRPPWNPDADAGDARITALATRETS